MSVKQIDEALRLWKLRLDAAAQNLLDLQSHPVYRRISAPDSNLSGETAEQSAIAVRTLGYLLQCFDLLRGAISRAEELREDMPSLFGAEEREREISAILQGKTIQLPAVQVPLQQRSLLTAIENVHAISPSELLTFMESAFENVKQIVLRLDAAWESVGSALEQASQRLSNLDGAARQLQSLQKSASADPLGPASAQIASLNECLEQLAGARNLLSSLKAEHESTRATCAEAHEKTGANINLDASNHKLQALSEWLERITSAAANTAPSSVIVGLKNWTKAAEHALASDLVHRTEARALLALRSELRGRLDALKAKARGYSLAEDDELMALANQATALLYTRPTPIDKASSVVAAYEAKLNSHARKRV